MHKFTVAEVSTPDFDISRLALDEEEILSIRTRFLNTSLELLKESEQFPTNDYRRKRVTAGDVYNKLNFSDQHILSFVFIEGLIGRCIPEDAKLTYPEYAGANFSFSVRDSVSKMEGLGNKIFSHSPYPVIVGHAFSGGKIDTSYAIQAVKAGGAPLVKGLWESFSLFLLNVLPPEDSKIFLEVECDKVRLAAYQKLGGFHHIDRMLLDKSAEIRRFAAEIMDYGDPRFKSLLKEKTKGVMQIALTKSPSGILPLFLANPLVKKDYDIKSLFEKRMGK